MKYTVAYEQEIEVTIDKKKFTKKFMREFYDSMYHFDTIEEHVAHLGQLAARGLAHNGDFIEGYGPAEDMGISFRITSEASHVVGPVKKTR